MDRDCNMAEIITIQEKVEQAWQQKCHAQFEERHEKRVYLSTRELQLLADKGVECPIYTTTHGEKLAYIKVDFDELIKLAK